MALTGLHVACCFGGARSQTTLPVISKPIWSEYMASAATTSLAAVSSGFGRTRSAIFRVVCSADALVAISPTPDVDSPSDANGWPHMILGGQTYDFVVETGDKLDWKFA